MTCIISASNVSSSPYNVLYRPNGENTFITLGSITAEGVTERIKKGEEAITSNALGGGTTISFVYTGQDRYLDMTLQEFRRLNVQKLIYDYTAGVSTITDDNRQFHLGRVGLISCQFAGALRLVPVYPDAPGRSTNSNAQNIEYYSVALANERELSMQMRAGLLEVNVMLRLFPVLQNPGNPSSQFYSFGQFTSATS